LKLGGFTVLLNCGWTESLDAKVLEPLVPHLGSLDLVLITHADLKHLGSLPYLLSKYPIASCPVVCTEPVCRLGELSCVACLEDREKYQAPVEDLDVDDVLRIFMSRLTALKYHENFSIQGKGRNLTVCPFPSGGQLGSAYWTLHCGHVSALYLVDYEMRRGRFLDGLELQSFLPSNSGTAPRWDVVITALPSLGSVLLPRQGALQPPDQGQALASRALTVARTVSEYMLLEESISTLRKGGTVLIPVDVVGSVPELLLLFEAAWAQDRQLATNYPLVWLSSIGDMLLDQIKTRLEYMSDEVLTAFEIKFGQNPFVLRNFRIFPTLEELTAAHPLSRPKVILTTSPYLEGGDSRELFMRLCSEPSTLLWLLGVPPKETLARQLVEDFVLKHSSRKDYRVRQYSKQPLPDEQLRAYYEVKVQELSEGGQKWPLLPEPSPKTEEGEEAADVKTEGVKDEPVKEEAAKEEVKEEKSIPVKQSTEDKAAVRAALKEAKSGQGQLWMPVGWPLSRTLAHNEGRSGGDEYGHVLTAAELKAWRCADQEGNKYNFPTEGAGAAVAGVAPGDAADDGKAKEAKEELITIEDDLPPPPPTSTNTDTVNEWRESLRVHFDEPMHCEVRERMVRVVCRVRLLPGSGQELQDMYSFLELLAPKHVVLLPTAGEAATEAAIIKHFRYSRPAEAFSPPELHFVDAQKAMPRVSVPNYKRKFSFAQDTWQKLSFLKTADDLRVARVRAMPNLDALDLRMLELKSFEPGEVLALENGTEDGGPAETSAGGVRLPGGRLPRGGSLFLGLARDTVSLSGLKEHLLGAELTKGEVEFCAPKSQPARPWSSRVLMAEGKAVLGWTGEGTTAKVRQEPESLPVLRIEGVPGEQFFRARAALYKRCALV